MYVFGSSWYQRWPSWGNIQWTDDAGSWVGHNPEFVTAVATIVLAGVTYIVASQTRAAAQAGVLPLLADVSPGDGPTTITYDHPDILYSASFSIPDASQLHVEGFVSPKSRIPIALRSVAVRNIGNGPARVQKVVLADPPRQNRPRPPIGWSVPLIIPVGGIARLMTADWLREDEATPGFEQSLKQVPPFAISVDYTDIKGNQPHRTTVRTMVSYMGAPLKQVSVDVVALR